MNLLWQPGHIKVLARCCNVAGMAPLSVFRQCLKMKRDYFKTILHVLLQMCSFFILVRIKLLTLHSSNN